MSLISISKKITEVCNDVFTPTVIASVLTVIYFNFHIVALGVSVVLLGADLVVSLSEKENNNE